MSAFGFVPVGTTDGSDYHGKMRDVILDTGANAFLGDMLVAGTNLAADETLRVTPAASGAAGNTLVGALVEIYPDFTDEGSLVRNYHASGQDGEGRICYGNDVIFEAREDAVAAAIDGADIGGSVDLIAGAGDLITGVSGHLLDSDTAAANLTQALEILRLGLQQANDFVAPGAANGAIFQVKINPVA